MGKHSWAFWHHVAETLESDDGFADDLQAFWFAYERMIGKAVSAVTILDRIGAGRYRP